MPLNSLFSRSLAVALLLTATAAQAQSQPLPTAAACAAPVPEAVRQLYTAADPVSSVLYNGPEYVSYATRYAVQIGH